MGASEGGCHVRGGLGDDFGFVEAVAAPAVGGGRSRRAGAGLEVREEEFALFELGAVGVVFGGQLCLAVL